MTQLINGGTQMQTQGSPSLECVFTYSVILIYSSRIKKIQIYMWRFLLPAIFLFEMKSSTKNTGKALPSKNLFKDVREVLRQGEIKG